MELCQPFDHSFHILYFYQSISESFKSKVYEKKKLHSQDKINKRKKSLVYWV